MAWLDPMVAPIVHGYAVAGLLSARWSGDGVWVESALRAQLGGGPDLNLRLTSGRSFGTNTLSAGALVALETFESGDRVVRWAPKVDFSRRF